MSDESKPTSTAQTDPTTTTTPASTSTSESASMSALASHTAHATATEKQEPAPAEVEAKAKRNAIGAWGLIPHFPSRNIQRTIDYYISTLHFTLGGTQQHSDGTLVFASVYIGRPAYRANIYFFLTPGEGELEVEVDSKNYDNDRKAFHPVTVMIGLATGQVDEYYERLVREGQAVIVDEIADRDYGYRQFAVRDHDGNTLQFFCFLEGGNPSD